ncbi:MAG: regulatory protein RecX [Bacteroidota bacterium]
MNATGTEDISGNDPAQVLKRIARYCAFRERCRKEVQQKLNEWKVPPGKALQAIRYLEENNFIREDRFAKSFARGKFHSNKWGRIKIQYELKSRDLPDNIIRDALQEIGEEEYMKTICDLVLKKETEIKAGKELNIREKIITFVNGKGFEFELIAKALKELKI